MGAQSRKQDWESRVLEEAHERMLADRRAEEMRALTERAEMEQRAADEALAQFQRAERDAEEARARLREDEELARKLAEQEAQDEQLAREMAALEPAAQDACPKDYMGQLAAAQRELEAMRGQFDNVHLYDESGDED